MKNKLLVIVLLAILSISAIGAVRTRVHTIYEKISAKLFILNPVVVTITANMGSRADGVAVYSAATPSKAANHVICQDTGGCYFYPGETSVTDGQVLLIVNKSTAANNITVFDIAGVREMSGNATLGQNDSLLLEYATATWVQVAPESDN